MVLMQLTPREAEVVRYLAMGMSNCEIARVMIISERTVQTHVGNIYSKWHIDNRTKAGMLAVGRYIEHEEVQRRILHST